MKQDVHAVRRVAGRICVSISLARDLLTLAGGDEDLVINASEAADGGVGELKAIIINERFKKEKERQA